MNTRLMAEGIRSDDSFVGLDGKTGQLADQATCPVDLSRINIGSELKEIPAGSSEP